MSLSVAQAERCVLVTGCSTGIGLACAQQLAASGYRVFASVRQDSDAQRLRDLGSNLIEPIELEVTCPESIRLATQTLQRFTASNGMWGLVNNAGILVPGPLELLSTDQLRKQLEVNVLGTHAVTQAMLPLLRQAGGRIVMIGSISGQITPPFYGAYSASKHALEALSDALRIELRPWGIRVSIIQPDTVSTGIWSKLAKDLRSLKSRHDGARTGSLYDQQFQQVLKVSAKADRTGLSVESVVRAVKHALQSSRPRARYSVGWRTRMAVLGDSFLPQRVMDWALRRSVGFH
jgi:NAD(P)-dependent dehydrogenase (short-subunit alcohol dehydrogenase family)